jgi:hypothetical protein
VRKATFFGKGVAGDRKNVFTKEKLKENRRQFEEEGGELLERLGYLTQPGGERLTLSPSPAGSYTQTAT